MKKLKYQLSCLWILTLFSALTVLSCTRSGESAVALKQVYKPFFPLGAAIGQSHLSAADTLILQQHFSSITAENDMKPSRLLGDVPGEYTFDRADRLVQYAEAHGMQVRGHTLTWYFQTPDWFFRNAEGELADRDVLLNRHAEYIRTVLGHFRGKVYCWDVVNEAISDEDSLFYREDIDWFRVCGPQYIEHAFITAREADPDVKLFYNDYNLIDPDKARKVYTMAKDFIERGVPIDGIGMQGHWTLEDVNADNLSASIDLFASLGLEVQITELDISVYPFYHNMDRSTLPTEVRKFTPELEVLQAEKYAEVFRVLTEKSDVVTGVTFWGVADNHTWLSNFFVKGRTDYPLLFDAEYLPKEAFNAISKPVSTRPVITITDEVLHPVNDHLFGHFMEKCSWGGEIGGDLAIDPATGKFDSLVLQKLKMLRIPNLRYPGGTDVDYYPWTDLIDHAPGQSQRKPYRRYREGPEGKPVSDNRLGLDEFLDLCELLGAEPILVLNIGDAYHGNMSMKEAAESAANLYAYCNLPLSSGNPWAAFRAKNGREAPYKVKFFEIGNEYWGFEGFNWNTGYGTQPILRLFNCIEHVADTLIALDPGVKIIADGALPELNRLFSEQMSEKIDFLVFHPYAPWAINTIFVADSIRVDPQSLTTEDIWNAWVAAPAIDSVTGQSEIFDDRWTRAVMETGFDIAATEWNWNGWFDGEAGKADLPQPDMAKGIGAAGFLHGLMRLGDRVAMACQSMTVGQSWGITGIRIDPEGRQNPVFLPSAQVTGLYARYHGNKLLKVSTKQIPTYHQPFRMNGIKPSKAVACLDVLATRNADRLFIHVINRSFNRPFQVELHLEDMQTGKSFIRHTLTGDKTAEISNRQMEAAASVISTTFRRGKNLILEVPEGSVSVFEIPVK